MATLMVMIALVPTALTGIRNMTLSGDYIIISRNGGINFYIGNNPDIKTTVANAPGIEWEKMLMFPYESERIENFSQQDAFWYMNGFSYIVNNPVDWLIVTTKKAILFFNGYEFSRNFDFYFFSDYSYITRLPFF